MGLFFTDSGAAARVPKGKKARRVIPIAEQKNLTCNQCPLNTAQLHHPKMPPTGSDRPVLYFLGGAPNSGADELGKHFVGDSGQFLRDKLPSRYEKHIRWNYTLRCRPPKNRDPEPLESACCRRLQVADIEQTKPKIIAGFGDVPLAWMLGPGRQINHCRGRRYPVKVGTHTCWFYSITDPTATLQLQRDKKKGKAHIKCFERDLQRMFADIDTLPDPTVEDPEECKAGITCLTTYGSAGLKTIESHLAKYTDVEHGIDIETDRLRPYNPAALVLSVAVGRFDDVLAFPIQHPEARWTKREVNTIMSLMRGYLLGTGLKWAHRTKFELEWFLKLFGPDILYKTQWGDTIGQAHILDERYGKSLDELTQLYFGFRLKDQSTVDVKQLVRTPLYRVLPYNAMDAKYCHALSIVQGELLEEQGMTHVYDFVNSATPALVMMQAKGVVRDLAAVKILNADLIQQKDQIIAKIMVQPDVQAYLKRGAKFSPTSNKNLIGLFRDHLKIEHPTRERQGGSWHKSGGPQKELGATDEAYSVDEAILSKMKHPVAAMVLDLRSVIKNHGYVTPLLEGGKYVHGDGLVHSSYNNFVTVTGRLASEDPNQQNYPRRTNKEIRRVIGCPPRHKFVAFDYGQLEWRIGAMLSADPVMRQEIANGQDIHGDWTDSMGRKFVPKLVAANRKSVRDSIKQYWTFANLYGDLIEGIAWDLSNEFKVNIQPRDVEPFYNSFWSRYNLLKAYQDDLLATYWKLGYAETGTGQRRHEPMARNELINLPFQGTAGHVVIDAQRRMSIISYEQDRPALQPIMNIHDDLSFYIPDNALDENIEAIAKLMCCVPFDFTNDVPLSVEVKIGDNWADMEEIAVFTTEQFK